MIKKQKLGPIVPEEKPTDPANLEEHPEPTPVPGMISVPKATMDELLKELKDMRERQEMLEAVADKKALALYYQRNRPALPVDVKIRHLDGRVIVAWDKMPVDKVEMNPLNRAWIEDQRVKLMFEDGGTGEFFLADFNRRYGTYLCRRTGIVKDEVTGSEAWKIVRYDGGKEYTVGIQFLN